MASSEPINSRIKGGLAVILSARSAPNSWRDFIWLPCIFEVSKLLFKHVLRGCQRGPKCIYQDLVQCRSLMLNSLHGIWLCLWKKLPNDDLSLKYHWMFASLKCKVTKRLFLIVSECVAGQFTLYFFGFIFLAKVTLRSHVAFPVFGSATQNEILREGKYTGSHHKSRQVNVDDGLNLKACTGWRRQVVKQGLCRGIIPRHLGRGGGGKVTVSWPSYLLTNSSLYRRSLKEMRQNLGGKATNWTWTDGRNKCDLMKKKS